MMKCKEILIVLLFVLCIYLVVGESSGTEGGCGEEGGVCFEKPNGGYVKISNERGNDSDVNGSEFGGLTELLPMITGAAIGNGGARGLLSIFLFIALIFILFFIAWKKKNSGNKK